MDYPTVLTQAYESISMLRDTFNLDQDTFTLCEDMLAAFLRRNTRFNNEPELNYLTLAIIYLASRQQLINAIDGSVVQGAGITINSILQKTTDIGQLLTITLEVVCELKLDIDTHNYLMKIKLSYEFLVVLFKKMESTLKNLDFNEESSSLVKNITWLLFLILKKHLFKINDLVESACLLISVLQFIIVQAISMCPVSKSFEELKIISETNYEKFQKDLLTQLLFSFKVKDFERFSSIHNQSQQYINELIKKNVLKMLKKQNQQFTMLCASIINVNYRKLDQFYKSLIKFDDFDETVIVPERISNLTPKKMTQIKLTENAQKVSVPLIQKDAQTETNQKFQRLLNYEAEKNITMTTNIKEIKLPTKSMSSPYAQQYVVATPMTAAMEMYNWVQDKQSIFKKFLKSNEPSLYAFYQSSKELIPNFTITVKEIKLIDQTFASIFQQLQDIGIAEQSKKTLYWSLYIKYLQSLTDLSVRIEESSLKCIVSVCIDCVNYILSKSSNLIDVIVPQCQLSNFKVWIELDHFLNGFDTKCPYQLKEHFLDLESKFISYQIWSEDNRSELISFVQQLQEENKFDRVFRRALHYCAFQIQGIGSTLQLNDSLLENVWMAVKYILNEKTGLLVKHSLDQICLCSFYGIVKISRNGMKFQEIIEAYEQMNSQLYSPQFVKKIICNVHLTNDQTGDIVQFYNEQFIPTVKNFLISLSGKPCQQQSSKNPALSQQVLLSPLKSILPSTPSQVSVSMTPSTKLLYAYTESPLLKIIDPRSFKENVNTQPTKKVEFSSDTAEFIQKKFLQMKSKQDQGFAYLSQGTAKTPQQRPVNNILQPQNASSESNGSQNYCKLLNFEQ